VAADRDGDGQPVSLVVGPSNGAHVAESDAAWLRCLINGANLGHCPNSPRSCLACGRNPDKEMFRATLVEARTALAVHGQALAAGSPEHLTTVNGLLKAIDVAVSDMFPPPDHHCPTGRQTLRAQDLAHLLTLDASREINARIATEMRRIRMSKLCATCGYPLDNSTPHPEAT
jgi:hypothetical protein